MPCARLGVKQARFPRRGAAVAGTALLCLAWPTVFWEASSQGLEDLGDEASLRPAGRRKARACL